CTGRWLLQYYYAMDYW
nr:immunoglobulin heavy chain junction region [Mus musculus]